MSVALNGFLLAWRREQGGSGISGPHFATAEARSTTATATADDVGSASRIAQPSAASGIGSAQGSGVNTAESVTGTAEKVC